MGRRMFLTAKTLNRIYPYRRLLIAVSIVCIVLAALVILENVANLSTSYRYSPVMLIIIPYLLAWLLIAVGVIGLKLSCIANAGMHNDIDNVNGTSNRRTSSAELSSPNGRQPLWTTSTTHGFYNYPSQSYHAMPQVPMDTSSIDSFILQRPPSYATARRCPTVIPPNSIRIRSRSLSNVPPPAYDEVTQRNVL